MAHTEKEPLLRISASIYAAAIIHNMLLYDIVVTSSITIFAVYPMSIARIFSRNYTVANVNGLRTSWEISSAKARPVIGAISIIDGYCFAVFFISRTTTVIAVYFVMIYWGIRFTNIA